MTPFYSDDWLTLYGGDCREVLASLPADSVDCVVTSPPYFGLRDYGTATWEGGDAECDHTRQSEVSRKSSTLVGSTTTQGGTIAWSHTCGKCGAGRIDSQLGLERTPEEYVANMVAVFREVRRVLKPSGTCWLNLGDSMNNRTRVRPSSHQPALNGIVDGAWADTAAAGGVRMSLGGDLKEKDLVGIPWMVAFALRADGWYLRSDIIWSKPNPMPESVTDRPTKSHEYVFLLTKSASYYFDADAVRERVSEAGVVEQANLSDETDVLRQNVRLEEPTPTLASLCVRLAATILDGSHTQDDLRLLPLDAEVGQQGLDDRAGVTVTGVPVVGRATELASGFTDGDVSAEQFLSEMHGLWVALPDGDQLKEAWRVPITHAALIDADGDGTVRVNDASQVGQVNGIHHQQYSTRRTPRSWEERKAAGEPMRHGLAGAAAVGAGNFRTNPAGRNIRSVWNIATRPYPGAHFAVFPPELPERCIKAGSSEKGVCPECGAPWERDWEYTEKPRHTGQGPKGRAKQIERGQLGGVGGTTALKPASGSVGMATPKRINGWRPTCGHQAVIDDCGCKATGSHQEGCRLRPVDPVPAVILDPFGGSGTVGMVANRLSRRAILIDLNPEYLKQQMTRNSQVPLGLTEGDAA